MVDNSANKLLIEPMKYVPWNFVIEAVFYSEYFDQADCKSHPSYP